MAIVNVVVIGYMNKQLVMLIALLIFTNVINVEKHLKSIILV